MSPQYEKRKSARRAIVFGLALIGAGSLLWNSPAQAEVLPTVFDWRVSTAPANMVGKILNQGAYGACWTFGAMASYESSWVKQMAENGTPVSAHPFFSERYHAWTAYAHPSEEPNDTAPLHDKSKLERNKDPVYDQGGYPFTSVHTMVVNGVVSSAQCAYRQKDMEPVPKRLTPDGTLHDMYGFAKDNKGSVNSREDLRKRVKELIKDYGAVLAHYDYAEAGTIGSEIYNKAVPKEPEPHAIALVGWDDDYEFQNFKGPDGKKIYDAWILRNSWGTDYGDNGYYYVSYKDVTLNDVYFLNAELDSGRYTIADGNFGWTGDRSAYQYPFNDCQISVASANRAADNEMVKALSFYTSNPGINYTVTIRSGSTPGAGQVLVEQSGTFGADGDGTSKWEGWRTVDLKSFVFLPKDKAYVVEITTQNPDTKIMAGSYFAIVSTTIPGDALLNRTYIYNPETGTWADVAVIGRTWNEGDPQNYAADIMVRAKESNGANGGDFTVGWLDDGGAGGSEIYLGAADELYGADALSADRRTLSNMTVSLGKDVANVYAGSITGEGGVTKNGPGFLALNGQNTYSGDTIVEAGSLSVNGSLESAVTVEQGATLQGSGVIRNSVTNRGSVAPGNSIGTLTVEGSYTQDATGILQLEGDFEGGDKLKVTGTASLNGMVYYKPEGYFANGKNTLKLENFIEADTLSFGENFVVSGDFLELWSMELSPLEAESGATDLVYLAVRAPHVYSAIAATPGGLAAGKALDNAVLEELTDDAAELLGEIDFAENEAIAAKMFDQLHPEDYDILLYSALANNQRLSGMISDRMTGSSAPSGQLWNWYFQPFGATARQNGWSGYGGYKSQSSGVLIGGDKRRGNWTWGVHGGFIHDGASVYSPSYLSSNSDGGFIGVQAKHAKDPEKGLFFYGLARAGWDRYETSRSVSVGDYERINGAKWTGFSGAVEIGAGWNSKKGSATLTPVAALNYAVVTRPSVTESCSAGNGSALNLNSTKYESLRSSLGVKANFAGGTLNNGTTYSVHVSALWHHEFLDRSHDYGWVLIGGRTSSTWRGNAGSDSVALALGAEFGSTEKFSVRAAVGTEVFRSGYSDFGGSLRFEWKF